MASSSRSGWPECPPRLDPEVSPWLCVFPCVCSKVNASSSSRQYQCPRKVRIVHRHSTSITTYQDIRTGPRQSRSLLPPQTQLPSLDAHSFSSLYLSLHRIAGLRVGEACKILAEHDSNNQMNVNSSVNFNPDPIFPSTSHSSRLSQISHAQLVAHVCAIL